MYVLEMVHGAVRRLYIIWNCAVECSYYYYYLSAKWGGIPLKCGTPGFDSHLYCGLFPGPVTPVTETCALHCALFPGPVTETCALHCALFPGPVTETCALHCALFPGPVTETCALHCALFPGPVTPVTETCALHCALFPGPVTETCALQYCLSYHRSGAIGSALGLVGPMSVHCDWVK